MKFKAIKGYYDSSVTNKKFVSVYNMLKKHIEADKEIAVKINLDPKHFSFYKLGYSEVEENIIHDMETLLKEINKSKRTKVRGYYSHTENNKKFNKLYEKLKPSFKTDKDMSKSVGINEKDFSFLKLGYVKVKDNHIRLLQKAEINNFEMSFTNKKLQGNLPSYKKTQSKFSTPKKSFKIDENDNILVTVPKDFKGVIQIKLNQNQESH